MSIYIAGYKHPYLEKGGVPDLATLFRNEATL